MTLIQKKAQQYILKNICSDEYKKESIRGNKNKLQFLYDTFMSEYGWQVEHYGEIRAFREWLMGLTNALPVAFYNYEILDLAIKWGTLKKDATEKRKDYFLENYWNILAVNAFQLFKKYNIK